MSRAATHRVVGLLPVVASLVLVAAACSVEETLPAPDCRDGGTALIAAQSVPTASQIPCFEPLPDGWSVARVSINQDRSIVTLDSDRAGAGSAVLRYTESCDRADTVSAPSEFVDADRFDAVDRLEPGFRGRRYYVFPGGCVWWSFAFDDDSSATEAVAIGDALTLISRDAVNADIRESFIDEEL